MLPDRSKRYVGVDGGIARLQLAANWQLILVALLVVALLVAIFPRKALIEKLYQQQVLDDLTVSYVQNLYRTNPNNADVSLLLARTRPDLIDFPALEASISGLLRSDNLRQRNEARTVLARAYRGRLEKIIDKDEAARLTVRLTALIESSLADDLPVGLTKIFADDAFRMDLPELGLALYQKLHVEVSASDLEAYGDLALGHGHHVAAAKYYFMARARAAGIPQARHLFQSGVRALMAAGQYAPAMAAAKTELGNLADDAPTLRFLSRTALAAGDPIAAATYARKLVFQ